MEPNVLTVYQSPYEKVRLGKDNDGGYIICLIPDVDYDCLLSGGVENDISFEENFCDKYKNAKCFSHDGNINGIGTKNQNIKFIRKNIGSEENDNITNLHKEIENFKDVFVKMDIEGAEIEWLEGLKDEHMDKIIQIVMEFHYPFSQRELNVFDKINKTHLLVHFHGNNNGGVRNIKDVNIPEVFECTYLNKKYTKDIKLNTETIPTKLDMRNTNHKDDIYIDYPPFVHKL